MVLATGAASARLLRKTAAAIIAKDVAAAEAALLLPLREIFKVIESLDLRRPTATKVSRRRSNRHAADT